MKTLASFVAMAALDASTITMAFSQPTHINPTNASATPKSLAQPFIARRGLPNVARKLAAGQGVSIVFIGGSVTEGGGQSGYAVQVPEWLKTQYPQAQIQTFNAGVGGTGSYYGWQRLDRDVLAFRPDLVVVEFAVNDKANGLQGMEAIVRKVALSNPETDMVLLYNTAQDSLSSYGTGLWPPVVLQHEQVAQYYDLPVVGTGYAVAASVNRGESTWKDLFYDTVHPTAAGYTVYSKAMIEAFKTLLRPAPATRLVAPAAPLTNGLVLEPPPFEAEPLPAPPPLISRAGETAIETFTLPVPGKQWGNTPDYHHQGKTLWRLSYQSADEGQKLNPTFGLDRSRWKGPMAYLPAAKAFCGHQPKASPLAYSSPGESGTTLGAKEATLGILSFITPKNGRYIFMVRSSGITMWSQHKTLALNVVHFPEQARFGQSVAFETANAGEKKALNMEFALSLQTGDEVAFEVDTNARGGGGGAFWDGLMIQAGRINGGPN